MQFNCAESHVRDVMAQRWGRERVLTIGRAAILTQAHNGRAACHYCGPCWRGCITHSYFNSIGSTLPAAAATGRLTLRPNAWWRRCCTTSATNRATGVRVVDAETLETLEFRRASCSCVPRRSRARASSSTRRARASRPDWETRAASSAATSWITPSEPAPRASSRGWTTTTPSATGRTASTSRASATFPGQHPKFLRGYGFQGGGSRAHWERGAHQQGFGAGFKNALLKGLGPWEMWLGGWGECLPRADNYCELHPTLKDKWGVPALNIHCTFGPNERALLEDMQVTAAEILEAAGAKDIRTFNDELEPGLCIHEMGTARMGRDAKTSVLNGWNQAHDVPNVFVTDGACMSSSANQNPSITYMALTARACDYAATQLKNGAI